MNHPDKMTFWEHLDELRASFIRILIVSLAAGIVLFFLKDATFRVLLAPKSSSFITYRLFDDVNRLFGLPPLESFRVELINTELAGQFLIHMRVAFTLGVIVVSPYILYLLFHFISPALYERERRASLRIVVSGYLMFMLGVAVSYFLIFPLTFRFLGTYQVSPEAVNLISLESYISSFLMLCLLMGLVFELPVVCLVLSQLGLISGRFMRQYRRHAIVAILVVAAVITPTSDVTTLLLVSFPMWMLYELSIFLVRK